MARPCPCIAVAISVYAASASSGTGAAAVYGLPCCKWRSMPAMLLFALQLSLLEARLRLIRATLASCLGRLPLHRFPLCRERLLCLGAHRGPFKGFRYLASAPLGVLRGLACFSGLVAEERELLPFASMQRRDNQGGRLLMRTPARPRLPDGDCVFISGGWIVARANAPGIAADMALLGFAPRCILVHIAFSVSKL